HARSERVLSQIAKTPPAARGEVQRATQIRDGTTNQTTIVVQTDRFRETRVDRTPQVRKKRTCRPRTEELATEKQSQFRQQPRDEHSSMRDVSEDLEPHQASVCAISVVANHRAHEW